MKFSSDEEAIEYLERYLVTENTNNFFSMTTLSTNGTLDSYVFAIH